MEMISLANSLIEYLFISSALLFILGVLSSFILRVLKIQGTPKLWICTLLIIMPLAYPIKVLFPDPIIVPIPLETYQPFDFQTLKKITGENPVSKGVYFLNNEGVSADETTSKETTLIGLETSNSNSKNRLIKAISGISVDWKLIATLAWGLTFLYFIIRLIFIVYKTSRFFRLADSVTNSQVLKLLHLCAADTGLHWTPRLMTVDQIPTPMVMGFFKPRIFLPKHLLKPEFREGLRFTLLHELKHVHQHHNWWLLIESIIGAAYFFHPVIHWAKKRIHEELEHVCDNHVIYITKKSISYADFLLHEIWEQNGERNPALAMPFISGISRTTNRVHSILENVKPSLFAQIRGKIALGLIFLAFLSLLLCSVAPSPPEREQTFQKLNFTTIDSQDRASFQAGTAEIKKEASKELKPKEMLFEEKSSVILTKEQPSFDDNTQLFQAAATNVRPHASNEDTETVLQEETTYTPVLKSEKPAVFMANTLVQAEKVPEKQSKPPSVDPIDEPILDIEAEYSALLAKNISTLKIASYASKVLQSKAKKHLGSPVNGITLQRIKNIRVLNDRTILFVMYGDKLYLNCLSDRNPGLLYADKFEFTSLSNKITKYDRIQALSYGQILNSTGMLGDFYPYQYEGTKTEAIKQLKNGLLEKLIAEGAFKESFSVKG